MRDFGAVGDGVTDDTAAIQKAIDAGGVVSFPKGTYLTGTIYLRSDDGLDIDCCRHVTVSDCIIGVGSGVIRHCTFSNLVMEDTRCAIHMNPLYGEDGTGVEMDDISFSDIHATAKMFIFLTLDYKWVGKNRFRGTMENIRFTNVSGEAKLPVTIRGNGLGVLRNVTWTDSTVRFTDPSALTDADKRFYMFDPQKPLGDKVQIDKAEDVVVRDVVMR